MAILEIRNLTKWFGGLAAISDLDFDVLDSEILGIIGPNGAGKSTLLDVVCGFLRPSKGKVLLKGEDISKLKIYEVAGRGIGRTFQRSRLFMKSTVLDNVLTGFHLNYRVGLWRTFLHTTAARKEQKVAAQKAMEILEFMGLASLKNQLAETLPYGHQRILEICMALATNPELLLLDEPVSGMSEAETAAIVYLIGQIRTSGVAVVLVEHNIMVVRNVCDRIVTLNYGRKIAEGLPEEVLKDKEVIKAYVGKEEQ